MAKKSGKAKAAGKKKIGKKSAKKAVTRKKKSAKKSAPVKKAKKKAAKKAPVFKAALAPAPKPAAPKPKPALKPAVAAPISITPVVTTCVNAYLDAHAQGWNDDGAGDGKALADLHVVVPLFLDNVRRCLEKKTIYTFDVTAVTADVLGGTVSKAIEEIVIAATTK